MSKPQKDAPASTFVQLMSGSCRITLLTFIILLGAQGKQLLAQNCAQALNNPLCAESAPIADSLLQNPLTLGCFNATMTYYASFTTGSGPTNTVDITVTPTDCDDFIGTSEITMIVAEVVPGANPCDPANLINPSGCFSDTAEFTAQLESLNTNTEYVVIVGSNHDSNTYGPCSIEVSATGFGIDIAASATPFLITLGESTDLSVIGADQNGYEWSPSSTIDDPFNATTSATPDGTTTYIVQSTIGDCTVTDDVTITVGPPVVIFNTITPNGDGINDEWSIIGIEKFEGALINVYDRWGQNIFRSLGYGSKWDGTNRGKYLPTGAYFYVIELNAEKITIPPITGTISIIH